MDKKEMAKRKNRSLKAINFTTGKLVSKIREVLMPSLRYKNISRNFLHSLRRLFQAIWVKNNF
jgi:hypothetical protein